MKKTSSTFDFATSSVPDIRDNGSDPTTTASPDSSKPFTDLEMALIFGIGVSIILFILQSICFIVCIRRVKSERRRKRKCSLISNVREPLSNQGNTERYSSRPLKQVSDHQLYESLKDLIPTPEEAAPPVPSIATLPKRKKDENSEVLNAPRHCHAGDKGKELDTSIKTRPRFPLPIEDEAPQLSPKNNVFATMPRIPFNKPVPKPIMSSTMSRYPNTNRDSPHTQTHINIRHKALPKRPEIPLPKPKPLISPVAQSYSDFICLPKPRSPTEDQNNFTLPPEPYHEIPVENELLQKLKKRAQLIPLSPQEIPVHQITNNPTRALQHQIKHEPHIQSELMQKLRKRAALIPDSENKQRIQQPMSPDHRVQIPKSKPLSPTPRHSDYEDGWEDNFDTIEPLDQIHMYNI